MGVLRDGVGVVEADVKAVGAFVAWKVDKVTLQNVLGKVYKRLQEEAAVEQDKEAERLKREWRLQTLETNWVIKDLSTEKKTNLVDEMFTRSFENGEIIIQEGKIGDFFYVLEEGSVEVWITDAEGQEKMVKVLEKGTTFGELAVLYHTKRTTSIKAKGMAVLQCIGESTLVSAFAGSKITQYAEFLKEVPIFAEVEIWELARLSHVMVAAKYQEGDAVIKKGDIGDCFYLVEEGKAEAEIDGKAVNTFESGACFGEASLLEDKPKPRTADVVARTELKVLSVDKATFTTVLGKVYNSFRAKVIAEKREKRRVHRQKVIAEFIQSENLYCSFLRIMIEQFMFPAREFLSEDQITRLFSNVEYISSVHEQVAGELKAENVGTVFAKYSEFLKCYSVYVGNYDEAMSEVGHLRNNRKFQKLLDQKRKDKDATGGLDLMSYLIMPIQRIPRYRMLLAEVQKYTEEDSADYPALSCGLEKIMTVASYVNEKKREVEESAKLVEVIKLIVGKLPEPLMQPHRRVLGEFESVTIMRHKKAKKYRIYAFNDLLVVTQLSGRFKMQWSYAKCHITLAMSVKEGTIAGLNIVDVADYSSTAFSYGIEPTPVNFKLATDIVETSEEVIKTLTRSTSGSPRNFELQTPKGMPGSPRAGRR